MLYPCKRRRGETHNFNGRLPPSKVVSACIIAGGSGKPLHGFFGMLHQGIFGYFRFEFPRHASGIGQRLAHPCKQTNIEIIFGQANLRPSTAPPDFHRAKELGAGKPRS
jgi:hypothetical protein